MTHSLAHTKFSINCQNPGLFYHIALEVLPNYLKAFLRSVTASSVGAWNALSFAGGALCGSAVHMGVYYEVCTPFPLMPSSYLVYKFNKYVLSTFLLCTHFCARS